MTLATSGWTYQSTFVLYDMETESIWFGGIGHTGRTLFCVSGFHQDKTLQVLPHERRLWTSWYRTYPHTKVMMSK